jgi:hypothetical protein
VSPDFAARPTCAEVAAAHGLTEAQLHTALEAAAIIQQLWKFGAARVACPHCKAAPHTPCKDSGRAVRDHQERRNEWRDTMGQAVKLLGPKPRKARRTRLKFPEPLPEPQPTGASTS